MTDQVSARGTSKPTGVGRPVQPLDATDRQILNELIRDARTSIRSMAERVHISRANACARVDRLVADEVITGFSARIDHARGTGDLGIRRAVP
jgi:DNA-binding Lrp family transcriptional regulator